MTHIKAGSLGPQNVGSVITFIKNGIQYITSLEGLAHTQDTKVLAFTPIQDEPFIFNTAEDIDLSLQHGALYIKQLHKDFNKFADELLYADQELQLEGAA